MASFPRFKRKSKGELAVASGELSSITQRTQHPDFLSLSAVQRAAFSTTQLPESPYAPVPMPGPDDWLSTRQERGQTYKSFSRRSFKHGPHGHCNTLEVVPIGTFVESESPALADLKAFMEIFFYGVTVRFTKPVRIRDVAQTGCLTDDDQLLCPDAMAFLRRRRTPRDVFAQIAVTMVDITPGEGWNFVYGQASMSEGVGIFSFARYGTGAALFKSSCKTMAHEVGHILGLKHCIYFHCLLNGNNGDEYAPIATCPVCLRKLHDACGAFDIVERYKALGMFYEKHGWKEHAFVQRRMTGIEKRVIEETEAGTVVAQGKGSASESKHSDTEVIPTTSEKTTVLRKSRRRRRRVGSRVHLEKPPVKRHWM